jgi:hypothetical protein
MVDLTGAKRIGAAKGTPPGLARPDLGKAVGFSRLGVADQRRSEQ